MKKKGVGLTQRLRLAQKEDTDETPSVNTFFLVGEVYEKMTEKY